MDYLDIQKLSREAYLAGRLALKTKIMLLAYEQTRAKSVLRITRKTTKPQDVKDAALESAGYMHGCGPTAWECGERRVKITAYLEVYAKIRNKPNCHEMKDYGGSYYYANLVKEAWTTFEQAIAPKNVESIA